MQHSSIEQHGWKDLPGCLPVPVHNGWNIFGGWRLEAERLYIPLLNRSVSISSFLRSHMNMN